MKKFIADYLRGDLRSIMYMLAAMAAGSALFTYSGASLGTETFMEKSRATVLALVGAIAIYLFWMVALNVVPNMRSVAQKIKSFIIIAIGCTLIFWLSSAFNVAGLAGKEALELNLSRYINELEETLAAQFKHSLFIESVSTDLRIEITRYTAAATDELENGTYSGQSGSGAVVDALNGIKGRLTSLQEEAADFAKSVEVYREQAQKKLEKIRKISVANKDFTKRMRDIARVSDKLRTDLALMDANNLADTVTRTLAALPREIDLRANFSSNAIVAKKQKAALDRVRLDAEQSSDVLKAFIEKATTSSAPEIKAFEKISPVRAVTKHWENYIPFWAAGIALDIAPLSVVVFLLIAMNTKTSRELAHIRMMNLRVEDVILAKMDEETIRRTSIDKPSLTSINRNLLGYDDRDKLEDTEEKE